MLGSLPVHEDGEGDARGEGERKRESGYLGGWGESETFLGQHQESLLGGGAHELKWSRKTGSGQCLTG